jgi:hypothetical protein
VIDRILERRRHIRFRGQWIIHYSPRGKDQFDETYTTDLSLGGIVFNTSERLPVSTLLKLKIRVSEYLDPIETVAVVARSQRKEKGHGFATAVKLVATSDENWERLVDWVLSHRSKTGYSLRRSIM